MAREATLDWFDQSSQINQLITIPDCGGARSEILKSRKSFLKIFVHTLVHPSSAPENYIGAG